MKKTVLLAIALVAGMSASMAQESTWGIKGGFNFPMNGFSMAETGDNINSLFNEEKRATGWHAGVYGRSYFTEKLFLNGNLLYLQKTHELIGKTAEDEISATLNSSGVMLDAVAGMRMLEFVRLQGGFSGIMHVNSSWRDTFDTFGTGYTFGVGVDLWKVSFDLAYYGSFKEHQGDWNGIPLNYNRSELLLSMSIEF